MSEFHPVSPNQNRYQLPRETIKQLTSDFLRTKELPDEERFVCFRVSGDHPVADAARNLEREVFEEVFDGNDAAFMDREYGPYESASTFFVSFDRETEMPAGVLRVMWNSDAGLKTINDLARPDMPINLTQDEIQRFHGIDDLDTCWDGGTVAVSKELQKNGMGVSMQLYRAMYRTAIENDIEHFILVIDEKLLPVLTDHLHIPFVPLCDTPKFSYLGSEASQAVYGHFPEFRPIIDRKLESMKGDNSYEQIVIQALRKIFLGSEDRSLIFDSNDGY